MVDAKRLLDQFLGGGSGSAPGQGGGGLGDLAQQLGGRNLPGGLGDMIGGRGGLGGLGGIGGGALAGGLAGILLGSKQGRKMGGTALKLGGMAVVGALAYRAYQNWQQGQSPQTARQEIASDPQSMLPPPMDTPFNPQGEDAQQSLSRKLLRAMIAAAKADGHVDAQEQANIFAEMDKMNLASDDKAFVMDELRAPLDVGAVADGVRGQEEAAEIYIASLLAIDVDNAAERGYLAMLAARLNLPDDLVKHLHATVEGVAETAKA
jgi:uncharacterized membrane protein YebE (DUF533 family)